ncbi:endonuclease dU [Methanopyrus kandleri]
MKLREVKPEIRVLGIDDGHYGPEDDRTLVVGVVMRGGQWIDGVMSTEVTVDGLDVTDRIAEMVNRSKHRPQLRVILTDGITFAGFNVLDIKKLHEETGLPVISVIKRRPDVASVVSALSNLDRTEERRKIVLRAGPVHSVKTRRDEPPVYFQCAGVEPDVAKVVLKRTATRHRLPEPIRVAHFIATGVTKGESSSDA